MVPIYLGGERPLCVGGHLPLLESPRRLLHSRARAALSLLDCCGSWCYGCLTRVFLSGREGPVFGNVWTLPESCPNSIEGQEEHVMIPEDVVISPGMDVLSSEGEKIGEVSRVWPTGEVTSSGISTMGLFQVDHGGILGLGATHLYVPYVAVQ